jgi:hypothetical protein
VSLPAGRQESTINNCQVGCHLWIVDGQLWIDTAKRRAWISRASCFRVAITDDNAA